METHLKYGKTFQKLHIDETGLDVFLVEAKRPPSNAAESGRAEAELIHAALAAPIDSLTLSGVVSPGQRAVVVTSDITRPCPSGRLLPPVLDELRKGGICDQDITVVYGLGSHRPHTAQERARLAGEEVFRRVRCIDSDPTDVELIGSTSRGTPVTVFRPVLMADVRVCLGTIEYHWFVGYGGGYKAIAPGTCGIEMIQANHRMMAATGAVSGRRIGNPVREDIDEAGAMVGVDFILNVILDESKRVVSAVAGHPLKSHALGCARLDAFGRATVEEPMDVVVVSAGGYPKDINLYQAQKALDNARHIARQGGIILLVAECAEGLGHATFEAWMRECQDPDEILSRIQQRFVLGGHKAAGVARAMKQAHIFLVSALPNDLVRSIGFVPFEHLDPALEAALRHNPAPTRLAVMPQGNSVLATVAST